MLFLQGRCEKQLSSANICSDLRLINYIMTRGLSSAPRPESLSLAGNQATNTASPQGPVNHPPAVRAGPDQTVKENGPVLLYGIAEDPDSGDRVNYSWRQISGPTVKLSSNNTTSPSFIAPNASVDTTLRFALSATDNKGATSVTPAVVTITVKHINHSPVANAGEDQTVNAGNVTTLDGSKSKDPDSSDKLTYSWVQTAGPNVRLNYADRSIATFTAPSNISSDTPLVFKLTVKDSKNATGIDDVKVVDKYIPPPNQPPVANAGSDKTVSSGATVILDSSGSRDFDGKITAYSWQQIAGPTVALTGNEKEKSFLAPSVLSTARLVFLLKVTDDKGASSAPDAVTITVRPLPQVPTGNKNVTNNEGNITSGTLAGFKSTGKINSLIHTPKAQWIATGNWSMTVDNGSLRNFRTNMTWFNALGNASHTHEFRNLNLGGKIITIHPDNSISLKGLMDVGTNHRIVWKNVPTTVDIHGGKTIIISVNDKATNHHFAGQPILGVVTSFVQCSDLPGPNMEVLPSCT